MTVLPKVLAYITRDGTQGREVLVFRRLDRSDSGVQVPGGGVEAGESLLSALHREVREETGLTDLNVVMQLATAPFFAAWRGEHQERNVFHLEAPPGLPDTWVHVVDAGEEDAGLVFELFWLPVSEAHRALRWGQGEWLPLL